MQRITEVQETYYLKGAGALDTYSHQDSRPAESSGFREVQEVTLSAIQVIEDAYTSEMARAVAVVRERAGSREAELRAELDRCGHRREQFERELAVQQERAGRLRSELEVEKAEVARLQADHSDVRAALEEQLQHAEMAAGAAVAGWGNYRYTD
jgi:chromosome segregation ATPase